MTQGRDEGGGPGRGNPQPEGGGVTRREAIQGAAVKAAVAALFGSAMTLDALTARAMSRIGDVRAAERIGATAAENLEGVRPDAMSCSTGCAVGGTHSCTKLNFGCEGTYGCTVRTDECVNVFNCAVNIGSTFNCVDTANKVVCSDNFVCKVNFNCNYPGGTPAYNCPSGTSYNQSPVYCPSGYNPSI